MTALVLYTMASPAVTSKSVTVRSTISVRLVVIALTGVSRY
jgi:hypothetical protein